MKKGIALLGLILLSGCVAGKSNPVEAEYYRTVSKASSDSSEASKKLAIACLGMASALGDSPERTKQVVALSAAIVSTSETARVKVAAPPGFTFPPDSPPKLDDSVFDHLPDGK